VLHTCDVTSHIRSLTLFTSTTEKSVVRLGAVHIWHVQVMSDKNKNVFLVDERGCNFPSSFIFIMKIARYMTVRVSIANDSIRQFSSFILKWFELDIAKIASLISIASRKALARASKYVDKSDLKRAKQ